MRWTFTSVGRHGSSSGPARPPMPSRFRTITLVEIGKRGNETEKGLTRDHLAALPPTLPSGDWILGQSTHTLGRCEHVLSADCRDRQIVTRRNSCIPIPGETRPEGNHPCCSNALSPPSSVVMGSATAINDCRSKGPSCRRRERTNNWAPLIAPKNRPRRAVWPSEFSTVLQGCGCPSFESPRNILSFHVMETAAASGVGGCFGR